MEKKIVILEDNWTDYEKIRTYFTEYDYYPDVQSRTKLLEFFQDIKNALNNKFPEKSRKTFKENLISLFQENCKNAHAYIIDYEFKEHNNILTGLEFHKQFIYGDYRKIYEDKDMPCIMPTKMKGNILRSIKLYTENINNTSLFTYTYKPNKNEDDTDYKRTLQDFVENAYPRVRLAKKIKDLAHENNNDRIIDTLDELINNPDNYKDNIDNILLKFIEYKSNRDKQFTNKFIKDIEDEKYAGRN